MPTAAASASRARAVKRERIQLFFRTRTIPHLRYIRMLQAISTGGAFYSGLLVWLLCDLPFSHVLIWTFLVFLSECFITVINDAFRNASPPDDQLWRWAGRRRRSAVSTHSPGRSHRCCCTCLMRRRRCWCRSAH